MAQITQEMLYIEGFGKAGAIGRRLVVPGGWLYQLYMGPDGGGGDKQNYFEPVFVPEPPAAPMVEEEEEVELDMSRYAVRKDGRLLQTGDIVVALMDLDPMGADVKAGDKGVVFESPNAYGDGSGHMVRWVEGNNGACNVYHDDVAEWVKK